ncbi:hypothetical protein MTR67_034649 [Solanum verrucosum]|uniref:Tf2-1-like SH3-like domain-containing protein n=1 Tax=Solanum verrucosum TaxID=315347 RepID=A0AAF0U8X9_SOLVR|nr:hypothetical protein MTR67_034649 [Solanum verrucosum]
MKGVMRFGRQGKLSPRFIMPFENLRTVGIVAYGLALPPAFSTIHLIFHVLTLHRYDSDESHVLQYDVVEVDGRLTYIKQLVAILARVMRQLRTRAIHVVKVYWRHRLVEEATWEIEQEMQEQFPAYLIPQVRPPAIGVEVEPAAVCSGDEVEDSPPSIPLLSSSRTGLALPTGGLVGAIMVREIES